MEGKGGKESKVKIGNSTNRKKHSRRGIINRYSGEARKYQPGVVSGVAWIDVEESLRYGHESKRL